MKKLLLLQFRPEKEVSDNEYQSFKKILKLNDDQIDRVSLKKINDFNFNYKKYWGIISGGSPFNYSDKNKNQIQKIAEEKFHKIFSQILERDIPYLGACYGVGLVTSFCGGEVSKEKYSEDVSATKIFLTPEGEEDPLVKNLSNNFFAIVGHKEACQILPPKAVLLASSKACPVELYKIKNNIYISQYHPELDLEGVKIRLKVYKNAGYFPPQEVNTIFKKIDRKDISHASKILLEFKRRYQKNMI